MIKFFLNMLRRGKITRERAPGQAWRCDPLAHPVLERMTPVELGDMPLGGARYDCSRAWWARSRRGDR